MSDDTTLRLTARGPATAIRDPATEEIDATERRDVTLEVTLDLDADFLGVSKKGAVLHRDDVVDHVLDELGDDTTRYAANYRDWAFAVSGRVDTWTDYAVARAQDRISVGTDTKVATLACHVLDSLAEQTDTDERPYLAMADLIANYDVSEYRMREVLLRADDAPEAASEGATEGEA